MKAHGEKKKSDDAEPFHVDESELQALTEWVAQKRIEEGDWELLHRYLVLFFKLSAILRYGKIRIKKISRLLFGNERKKKTRKILRRIRINQPLQARFQKIPKIKKRMRISRLMKALTLRNQAMAAGRSAIIKMRKRLYARFVKTSQENSVRLANGGICGKCLLKWLFVLRETLLLPPKRLSGKKCVVTRADKS
jgi:hypothetical protein